LDAVFFMRLSVRRFWSPSGETDRHGTPGDVAGGHRPEDRWLNVHAWRRWLRASGPSNSRPIAYLHDSRPPANFSQAGW